MLHCGQSSMSLGEMTVKEQAETAPNGGGATRASPAEPAGRILSRRGTVVQAKFASRMAQKMSNRRADRVTIRKDRALAVVAIGGIVLSMPDEGSNPPGPSRRQRAGGLEERAPRLHDGARRLYRCGSNENQFMFKLCIHLV